MNENKNHDHDSQIINHYNRHLGAKIKSSHLTVKIIDVSEKKLHTVKQEKTGEFSERETAFPLFPQSRREFPCEDM